MKNILITVLVAAIVSFGTYKLTAHDTHIESKTETAYDRVMRTKTLRCGYNVWPPVVTKDANTGAIGGFIPEMVEYAASTVGIKVEWTQQAGWSTFPQDIKNGRFDAMCAGAWATKELAPFLNFTRPVFFNPLYAYVRIDDTRFDNDLSILNDSQYKIGTVDSTMNQTIAAQDFPKAGVTSLPQLTDPAQVLTDLVYKKSDITFTEGSLAQEYEKKNPGKIRALGTTPYRSFPSPLMAASIDDPRLTTMFDTIIGEMQLQGTIKRILTEHQADPKLFVPPAKPYQE